MSENKRQLGKDGEVGGKRVGEGSDGEVEKNRQEGSDWKRRMILREWLVI